MIMIDVLSEDPLYIQIYHQIKEGILKQELREGSKLPSTRELSKSLNVSRNTVDSAYLQLCSEGYIRSKKCSGFIVEKIDHHLLAYPKTDFLLAEASADVNKETAADVKTCSCRYDFQYGKLSAKEFPVKLWRKFINQNLIPDSGDLTSYSERKGEYDLRVQIRNYLHQYRGVKCTPRQIIILPGTQPCLTLVCQLLRNDFQSIAMEDPGYDGARYVFENSGYQVVPISLHSDGLDLDGLECSPAKLLYMTPSHQFPMGYVTPIQKRMQLLEWAMRNDGYIIEDDYDSELRYSGRPIPSLQCIDPNGRVIYTGTFSKALSPALRISYLVLPERLTEKYEQSFFEYDSSVPWILQKALEQFMSHGHWENHLKKICLSYKKKHDLLVKCIEQSMGSNVTIHGKNAGLHLLIEVHSELSEEDLIRSARNNGVAVYPVSPYWIRKELYQKDLILLGFSSLPEEEIVEGIRLLHQSWFG